MITSKELNTITENSGIVKRKNDEADAMFDKAMLTIEKELKLAAANTKSGCTQIVVNIPDHELRGEVIHKIVESFENKEKYSCYCDYNSDTVRF